MKILINTPNYKNPQSGGVANHYYGLFSYWKEDVKYNIVGNRGFFPGGGALFLLYDIIKFIIKILIFRPDVIILNPSLARNAMRRDSLFLKISYLFNQKVVVFFHGFNLSYAEQISPIKFMKKFKKASTFIVLSAKAKDYLLKWGISVPIYLSTTKVENSMLEGFDIKKKKGLINNILFLSRIEKEKGIFIALDVFKILNQKYPNLKFTVVGDGSELNNAIVYSKKENIKNIKFTGMLSGDSLKLALREGDLYLFTSYHEGMPTSVLEAMAFGLPIISRPVGGLVDFFRNDYMGELIDSFNPSDFIQPIERYMASSIKTKEVSLFNYNYAQSHFLASEVACNIECILLKIAKL